MNLIYHGCFTKNADGTNKIILAGERCLYSTAKTFWKFLEDIEIVVVKVRSQTKREQQRLTKTNSMNIFKTRNVFTDGSLHQIQSRNLQIVFLLFNSCCFARVYREQ